MSHIAEQMRAHRLRSKAPLLLLGPPSATSLAAAQSEADAELVVPEGLARLEFYSAANPHLSRKPGM